MHTWFTASHSDLLCCPYALGIAFVRFLAQYPLSQSLVSYGVRNAEFDRLRLRLVQPSRAYLGVPPGSPHPAPHSAIHCHVWVADLTRSNEDHDALV